MLEPLEEFPSSRLTLKDIETADGEVQDYSVRELRALYGDQKDGSVLVEIDGKLYPVNENVRFIGKAGMY